MCLLQLGVHWPLWLLTSQETGMHRTDSGQPIRAWGAWSMSRLTSPLSVTFLTPAGPHDGKYEEPGATLAPRQKPTTSVFSLLHPPTSGSSLKPCCVTTRSNTCCPYPEAHLLAFYCHADVKSTAQKNNVCTHTFFAQSCVTCIFPVVYSGPVLGGGAMKPLSKYPE